MWRVVSGIILALGWVIGGPWPAVANPTVPIPAACATIEDTPLSALERLEIVTREGSHAFEVEIAADDAQRARGLMCRRELGADRGVLFDFGREQPIAMWMRNTLIPLDMIFIRADGRIHRIAENTVPLSEEIVPSVGPVLAVLEVPGGTARRLGLMPGQRVSHRIFRR